ncbi:MAG: DUF4258 domain-containing protein [Candidatus Bathyarchaeia archaeon]
MTIIFTLHALERIKHRKINRDEVVACIINPDKIERAGEIMKAIRKINGQVLVAYYRHEDENIIIITAYKSSRIHGYLRQ